MSEQFFGEISIGGILKRSDLPGFIKAVNDSYYDDTLKTEKDVLGYIQETDEVFEISSGQASWGEFKELEEFCREHDLSYNRRSDHHSECNAEFAIWRPGMAEPNVNMSDTDGDVVINVDQLKRVLKELQEFIDEIKTVEGAPLKLNSEEGYESAWAQRILDTSKIDPLDLLSATISRDYPDFSELPPFKIIN
jgi:hypothetical protein